MRQNIGAAECLLAEDLLLVFRSVYLDANLIPCVCVLVHVLRFCCVETELAPPWWVVATSISSYGMLAA